MLWDSVGRGPAGAVAGKRWVAGPLFREPRRVLYGSLVGVCPAVDEVNRGRAAGADGMGSGVDAAVGAVVVVGVFVVELDE
ncbi:hypothetical protein BSL84_34435 [Streptomyces sp. TN58]|nr:hypothetical protein BSL84_00070 [Streptomyces sp. TN58]APU44042.1 hypothetical protein BSL84_34435 [Streptomyces sp. TN58]